MSTTINLKTEDEKIVSVDKNIVNFSELITKFEDSREKLYETVISKVTYENIYINLQYEKK